MNNSVQSFTARELLVDACRYVVPMYQRNYAWGEAEIHQLIQDVLDYQQKSQQQPNVQPYYIGTLVVYKRTDGSLEVIDGQQRFTTLTLLAICLKRLASQPNALVDMTWYKSPNLDFESRPSSSYTFASLSHGVEKHLLTGAEHNEDMVNGFVILEKALLALGGKLAAFCGYLFSQVRIARVPVPEKTDLNHYFEVMNSRAEQLEKHEVVKARLMSVLNGISDNSAKDANLRLLTKVWDASSNMERYVQYGFTPTERHQIFGQDDWGQFTPTDYNQLLAVVIPPASNEPIFQGTVDRSLRSILEKSATPEVQAEGKTTAPERFSSIINFPNFLLQVLRVWTGKDVALDDKQLLAEFDQHILRLKDSCPIEATQSFIFALLKCKYLFDQFIIKREFAQGEDKWSLKRLHFYNEKSQSYINTFDNSGSQDNNSEDGFEGDNRRVLMLLSALHVSTPTQVYKHWLNGALVALYSMPKVTAPNYLQRLESMARQFVYGRFLSVEEPADYFAMIYRQQPYRALQLNQPELAQRLQYGGIENNLVFNYLDYLLWTDALAQNTTDPVIKQFEFTFRSSVEHFYPQHPMDGHAKLDEKTLHRFGNLCLISHSKNSRLSNFQPKAKRDHFRAAISKKQIDSLKIYKMFITMDDADDWGATEIETHEQQMIKLLEEDSKIGAKG